MQPSPMGLRLLDSGGASAGVAACCPPLQDEQPLHPADPQGDTKPRTEGHKSVFLMGLQLEVPGGA